MHTLLEDAITEGKNHTLPAGHAAREAKTHIPPAGYAGKEGKNHTLLAHIYNHTSNFDWVRFLIKHISCFVFNSPHQCSFSFR